VTLSDDADPAPLPVLRKLFRLPSDFGPPSANLPVEQWSLTFYLSVAETMSAEEIERVRLIYVRLARLAAALDKASPLGGLPRHTRRALKARGVDVLQKVIALLLDIWRDIDLRLMAVPAVALILRAADEDAMRLLSLAEAAVGMSQKRKEESPERRLAEAAAIE
jgi:hypothetical protein